MKGSDGVGATLYIHRLAAPDTVWLHDAAVSNEEECRAAGDRGAGGVLKTARARDEDRPVLAELGGAGYLARCRSTPCDLATDRASVGEGAAEL
jgi:hypothetical protein